MKDVPFKVFSNAANMQGGRVVALLVPGGSAEGSGMPRSEIDSYTQFVGIYGAKGLAYIRVNDIEKGAAGLQSPIVKNLTEESIKQILERTGAKNGDLIFFGADKAGRQTCHGCLEKQNRLFRLRSCKRPVRRSMGSIVGYRFPDVRIQRKR